MNIGNAVDDFTLASTGGDFQLSALRGGSVVLFFYPRDDTPGCTIEGNEFSTLLPKFAAANATVLGISRDTLKKHEKFRAKYAYSHHLLADPDETICNQFDVMKNKTMYGKPVRGIVRSTFVIDKEGRLAHEWRNIKSIENHAATVLTAVLEMR